MTASVKSKKACCKSRPRCARCPVVCKRLEQAGYLHRESKRTWVVERKPPKKAVRAARG